MEQIEKDYETLGGALVKAEYQELDNDVLGQPLRTFSARALRRADGGRGSTGLRLGRVVRPERTRSNACTSTRPSGATFFAMEKNPTTIRLANMNTAGRATSTRPSPAPRIRKSCSVSATRHGRSAVQRRRSGHGESKERPAPALCPSWREQGRRLKTTNYPQS